MRSSFFIIIFGLTLTTAAAYAQDVNQMDASGERHGLWEKYYPESNQLRFTGEFHHGKERGKFKFYCQTCGDQPSAIIDYGRGNDIAKVKYLDLKGKEASKTHGRMGLLSQRLRPYYVARKLFRRRAPWHDNDLLSQRKNNRRDRI